jgi:hypothetical protein
MTLKEDARKMFTELFGSEVAKQVDDFDNPDFYPEDFLEECMGFLKNLIGQDAAEKHLRPLYEKYGKNSSNKGKHARRRPK